jgi:hypothetical protein
MEATQKDLFKLIMGIIQWSVTENIGRIKPILPNINGQDM